METIPRQASSLLRNRLEHFPAAALVGPRQAGKTTLAKSLSKHYYDLEQEQDRLRLDIQWEELTRSDALVILDEAQSWPAIFSRLRGSIDADRKRNGRFLLLGSVSPALMREVSESLAGRIAIVELTPLSASELEPASFDALWRFGGFPDGGVLKPEKPTFPAWQSFFLSQMAQRDLPAWGLPAKPGITERLMRLIAATNGAALNASQFGQALGLSYHTINSYLDFLEGAFLIRRLRPFEARNFSKRLVKSPKIYWRDSGLLHALLECDAATVFLNQPWAGASWEGWVIEQLLAARSSRGDQAHPYYFRTGDGLECDLLWDKDGAREVIEIKLTSSPSTHDFKKLTTIAKLVGATRKVLISRIPDSQCAVSTENWSVNLSTYLMLTGGNSQKPALNPRNPQSPIPSVSEIFARLKESDGSLIKNNILTEETLIQRSQLLHEDLETIKFKNFQILPTREVADPDSGLVFKMVEYSPGKTDHDIDQAGPGFAKDARFIQGSQLSCGSLSFFAKVCSLGHSVIPHLWLGNKLLRDRVRAPTQHFDTLNEIWWLSRWHGIVPGSVRMEFALKENASGRATTVDWQFQVLGGAMTINLEVKNRRGTSAAGPMKKGVYLFGDHPEKPFRASNEDEINVLAISAYHAGVLSPEEEAAIVGEYLDETPAGQVIDAVAIFALGHGSYERLYFPKRTSGQRKSMILRSLRRNEEIEDHSMVLLQKYPVSLDNLLGMLPR